MGKDKSKDAPTNYNVKCKDTYKLNNICQGCSVDCSCGAYTFDKQKYSESFEPIIEADYIIYEVNAEKCGWYIEYTYIGTSEGKGMWDSYNNIINEMDFPVKCDLYNMSYL